MLLLKIDHVYGYDTKHSTKLARSRSISRIARLDGRGQCDLFLVTTLRYAASDNFNYLHGCLTLLPSVFSWAPGVNKKAVQYRVNHVIFVRQELHCST